MASTWVTRAATCSIVLVTGFLVALYFYKRKLKKEPGSAGQKREEEPKQDKDSDDKEKEDADESSQTSKQTRSQNGDESGQMSSSMGQSFEFIDKGEINGKEQNTDTEQPSKETRNEDVGKEFIDEPQERLQIDDNTSTDKTTVSRPISSMVEEKGGHVTDISNQELTAGGDCDDKKQDNDNSVIKLPSLEHVSDDIQKSLTDFLESRDDGDKSTETNTVSPDTHNENNSANDMPNSHQENKNGHELTNGCDNIEKTMTSMSVKTVQSSPKSPQRQPTPPIAAKTFSTEEMSDALLVSQNSPGLVSSQNAEVLVSLLYHADPKMQLSALTGINRCSSFSRNQNLLRENGCLPKLGTLLQEKSMSLKSGDGDKFVTSIATAINNLSANEENHKQLKDCVPTLVDITLEDETGESVCLSSLQALTNLSVTPDHHGHYTRIVQKLYNFIEGQQKSNIRLQAAKILVNLSCNPELVPHMLAAKAPSCVLDLLKTGTDEAILLRWTTLLANILQTVKDGNLSASSLPPDDKAPSPETMFSALYGMNNIGHIKSKIFLLCRHRNEDIKHQASRIYQILHAK